LRALHLNVFEQPGKKRVFQHSFRPRTAVFFLTGRLMRIHNEEVFRDGAKEGIQ
jgi:hypothetical protein